MEKPELQEALLRFVSDTELHWKETVDAVNSYIAQHPDTDFDNTFQDGQVDRALDGVVLKVAWIKDRMDGVTTHDARGSLSKKLRKALGYNG